MLGLGLGDGVGWLPCCTGLCSSRISIAPHLSLLHFVSFLFSLFP